MVARIPELRPRGFRHLSAETTPVDRRILSALGRLFSQESRVVLAVSGGIDSMTLLDAAGLVRPPEAEVVVATFDHGTGAAASAAVALVRREAERRGFPVESARSTQVAKTEAEWRNQRWRFLRDVAARHGAVVVTAHTLDDQLETVVMRLLRQAGVRGLAALHGTSPKARPLLDIARADVMEYARDRGLAWVDDPTNQSRAHLRNRVRLDLLPALQRANRQLPGELLALSRRAAEVRERVDEIARTVINRRSPTEVEVQLADWPASGAGAPLLWQSVAAIIGAALDWRGTERLTQFGATGRAGTRIPLSAGFEAVRYSASMVLRRRVAVGGEPTRLEGAGGAVYGAWRFQAVSEATIRQGPVSDPWLAWLPIQRSLSVRAWHDGDRMAVDEKGRMRRVKRFFADHRVAAPDREGWPVVVADDEIVWIPGIRRGPAATARSGRPAICFICERDCG
jgi:tRNA(Ile)-lysidine synthase